MPRPLPSGLRLPSDTTMTCANNAGTRAAAPTCADPRNGALEAGGRGPARASGRPGSRRHTGAGRPLAGYRRRQSADSISRSSSDLGRAPATDCTGWPPLKTVSVGTDITR